MKLLCINNKTISRSSKIDGCMINATGEGLVEGKIYKTIGKPFNSSLSGYECYYIQGMGAKLSERFTELLDNEEAKTIEEEIQEAVESENYELADKLTKSKK